MIPRVRMFAFHIKGSDKVQEAIDYYEHVFLENQDGIVSLDAGEDLEGELWKHDRTTPRHFILVPNTPILIYRSALFNTIASIGENAQRKHYKQYNAALDLSYCTAIRLKDKRVIELDSPSEKIELTTFSESEARRWVTSLNLRKKLFNSILQPHLKKQSQTTMARKTSAAAGGGTDVYQSKISQSSMVKKSSAASEAAIASKGRELFIQGMSNSKIDISLAPKRTMTWKATMEDFNDYYSPDEDADEMEDASQDSADAYPSAVESIASNPPPTLDQQYWRIPTTDRVQLRGFNYLNDKKKVQARRQLMTLVAVDCYAIQNAVRIDNISSHPMNRISARTPGAKKPFTWIISLQVPAQPHNFAVCFYFCPSDPTINMIFQPDISEEELSAITQELDLPPGFVSMLRKYFFGNDQTYRNERFKMVPIITDGPWIVKQSVPTKPALLGRKLPIRYYSGENYLEMDVDIGGGSRAAKTLTELSVGYASSLVFEVAFLLEGRTASELPEEVLAMASLVNLDIFNLAKPISPVTSS